MVAMPEGGISVTSHKSLVTSHLRFLIPSYQSLVTSHLRLLIPSHLSLLSNLWCRLRREYI